jgi:hypothetical protein
MAPAACAGSTAAAMKAVANSLMLGLMRRSLPG